MAKVTLEPLPFAEAIGYFRDRVPLPPEQYKRLEDEYKTKAFTVGGIAALDVLSDIMKELLKALEEGLTAADFRKSVNQLLEDRGWEGLTRYRADNIFRTNIQTAFNVGRHRQMTDPDIIRRRPYWMYDAVGDRKTRPTHMALDGMVYPADHPFWDTWYPPNGFK